MKFLYIMFLSFVLSISNLSAQWKAISNGLFSTNVNSVLIMPERLVVACEKGIFIKKNDTPIWRISNYGLEGFQVRKLVEHNKKVYAATDKGIFYSNNKADSWIPINKGIEDFVTLSFATDNKNMFAGGISKGIFCSSDSGHSWKPINGNLKDLNVSDILLHDNTIFIGTYFAGMAKSTDLGNSWQPINNGLNSKSIRAVKKTNDNTIIIAGSEGIFKSTDAGNQWIAVNNGLNATDVHSICISGDTIIAGTTKGIYCSYDLGNNWKPMYNNTWINNDVRAVEIKDNKICAGYWDENTSGSCVYLSENYGNTWNNADIEKYTIYPIASVLCGKNIIAGTCHGSIFLSTDTGDQWTTCTYWKYNDRINNLININDTVYAATIKNGVLMSVDSGFTWHTINYGLKSLVINDIIANENTIFVTTDSGVYAKKTNSDTWIAQNSKYFPKGQLEFFGERDYITIYQKDSCLYLLKDEGAAIIDIDKNNMLKQKNISAMIIFKNWIVAGTSSDGIFYTSDEGENWQQVENSENITSITDFAVYDGNLFVSTYMKGVYLFVEAGSKWLDISDGMDVKTVFSNTLKIGNDGYIYAGGRGFYKARLRDFELTDVKDEYSNSSFNIFPNPFNEKTYLSYRLNINSKVEISVYDFFGKLIKILFEGEQEKGKYTIEWDACDNNKNKVNSGHYYLHLKINGNTIDKKAILIK